MSVDGATLAQFGWVFHTHGKAKTGYLGRLGLHRVLSWPFLYKAYAIGDFAEFLETFGLPIILGKYFAGASPEEKASLMRAVTALGHDARAIMPQDMELEVQKIVGGGDSTPHLAMVDWAERSESKAILGQTMSAEAKSTGIGSGNADLHQEVRQDILKADAREIAGTLTRDLLYPLIALNRGNIDGLRRCPRFVFDTGEAEDIKLFADALPKLVGVGMQIPVAWSHDKLRIPQPADGEPILATGAPEPAPVPPGKTDPATLAALAANEVTNGPGDRVATETRLLENAAAPALATLLAEMGTLVDSATDMANLQAALLAAYGGLDMDRLTRLMEAAFALAELKGLADVTEGQ